MKKALLILSSLFLNILNLYAQSATNFTVSDCASGSHTLFTELDAGKVIVITWVMPCGTCINGASTAATTVQGYAGTNPGRVKFYLIDDYGNSSCSSVSSWASTNSIPADAKFGNGGNAIKMTDYGTTGMPKTVVLGGASHTVFFNQNGNPTTSALQTAINNALSATTAITEATNAFSSLNIFPNPATNIADITYSLQASSDVSIELFNLVGEKVKSVFVGKQNAGEVKLSIDCTDLKTGFYFVKVIAGISEQTIALSVSH